MIEHWDGWSQWNRKFIGIYYTVIPIKPVHYNCAFDYDKPSAVAVKEVTRLSSFDLDYEDPNSTSETVLNPTRDSVIFQWIRLALETTLRLSHKK